MALACYIIWHIEVSWMSHCDIVSNFLYGLNFSFECVILYKKNKRDKSVKYKRVNLNHILIQYYLWCSDVYIYSCACRERREPLIIPHGCKLLQPTIHDFGWKIEVLVSKRVVSCDQDIEIIYFCNKDLLFLKIISVTICRSCNFFF